MGGGCGQRDRLAEGSSRFLSDLGASSFAAVFPALEISWKESWVQAGIVVIYLASSFSGGRMAGNMAGKRRFLWGICFGIVYFAILIIVSAVFLPGGFAGAGRLLWAAAVCAVGGMAGGMTAHGR